MRFCEWLRNEKDNRGLTTIVLSKGSGIAKNTINAQLRGAIFPREETWRLYCRYFGIAEDMRLYEAFRREEDELRHRWERGE